ncbi:hypothetical protein LEP1GSC058_1501 [Leptospira fainei serovar Hurstbridge str. BUT 6]|uniref:Cys-rich protein n=2 Tax=Leptospira fainei TaxID=48782 RepID=S3UXD4_9LEPT|nr:hypothetical protein LEP1GSC058_1501 [Leptospira fainei serovar Hurstbridge str. BUT 6]
MPMNKTLLLTLTLLVSTLLGSSNLKAQNPACGQICDFYVNCVESQTKKKFSAEEQTKVSSGCLNTCRKNFPAVTQCYENHSNQCVPFHACLVNTYKSKEKK